MFAYGPGERVEDKDAMGGDADQGGYRVLWRIRLGPGHRPTGFCRHSDGLRLLPPPTELMIVRVGADPGINLIHLDERGREMTDTYHDTVRDAKEQARLEFSIRHDDWLRVDDDAPD